MATDFSGGGDPARTMALLWRDREAPAGRAGLTVERIVETAIALADGDGVASLSMRKVADRLGVGAMSLYTYVPGKAELLDLMVDGVLGEAISAPVAGGWRDRLTRVAFDNLALYRRHPWLLQVATARPPLGPNLVAKYDHELGALVDTGLSDVEIDKLLSAVLAYVNGAAHAAVEAASARRRSGQAQAPLPARVFDADRYPLAARIGAAAEAYGAVSDPAATFDFGLQRLLDGIEALVAARAHR
jgi:AcrR family transcriptional regulator